MLSSSSDLIGYAVRASDGEVGTVADLLFDDHSWTVRWAVVDTGGWITGRQVLLPPSALARPDPAQRAFLADLTRERIENSPGAETEQPVSRQMETDLYGHYGWPPYWGEGYMPPPIGMTATGTTPEILPPGDRAVQLERDARPKGDPHLRSIGEVSGYHIRAQDDSIGHVEDFLIDGDSWTVRYLVIDTRNWWPGKQVLVAPQWIRDISWTDRQVAVDLTTDEIKASPEYDPSRTVDRAYEERLYGSYRRPPYWI
jgi:uncharacterized protein YrrD